ncbi:MAG: protein translocase subunit SecD [Burkholderiales bacterium]
MNRYSRWQYILIAGALVVGLFYTLPNFFGEVPAVQVQPQRATLKADSALMGRVEDILKKGGIVPSGIFLDATSVKARFADTDIQLKAKDVLQSQLGEDYVVALNLLSNSPRWLASIGALPMYLGLDLRGGVHFLLQVDMKAAIAKKLEATLNDVRGNLREKRILYSGVTRDGQAITVRFRDQAVREKGLQEIARALPDLDLRTVDDAGEFRIVATLKPEAQKKTQDYSLQQNITTLRNRVNELGVAEPIIQQQGADRVVVQLPGVQDTAKAKDILGRTATLEVRMVDDEASGNPAVIQAAQAGQVPFGDEYYVERGGAPILVRKQVVLTGDRINDAQPGFDNQTGEPAVHISLDGTGARIFHQVTRENVGKRMAILLFEKGKGEVVTAPVIRSEIPGGRVQISGRMTTQEAHDVSLLLRAGALAAPMDIIEERTVGPSLGAENIRIGFQSTWYGFTAIAVYMIAYYALFGVFSIVALSANVLFLVALLSMLQATLTLPGMAGIALTIGMAIDANVLINERVREELRNGNTPQAAIHAGYDRAWGTILDSNITTLIAGLFLFLLGSGPVKGFAVVLCLGILTSQFSAVMVSRAMVNLYYGSRRRLESISIGQVWRPQAATKA